MKPIELDELKQIECGILRDIDQICRENGIQYSLCGGTLLGAVRHGGFIPWDDDIDILMTRENYEKFIRYCIDTNDLPFHLMCNETNQLYGYLFAKVMNKNTVVYELVANPHKIEYGICVDVFPVDYLGDTRKEAEKNFCRSALYRRLLDAKNWTKYFRSKTRSIVCEPIRLALFLMSRFYSEKNLIRKIEKINGKFAQKPSKFSGCITGLYGFKEILPTELFTNLTELPFESEHFKAFKDYDVYLRSLYGDYMKLPPEEKRITHHMFEAYWKDDAEDNLEKNILF